MRVYANHSRFVTCCDKPTRIWKPGHNRSSASRTPIASVVTQASRFDHNNGAGSRIRNVFARDGGRTQSGGVRGIVDDINDF